MSHFDASMVTWGYNYKCSISIFIVTILCISASMHKKLILYYVSLC